jgi:glycosyltransferase involved in cell wall biosynthesis
MVDAVFRRADQNNYELSPSDKNILSYEVSAMQNCDYALCISQRDLEYVMERFPSVKAIVFPIIRFSRNISANKVVNPVKLLFIGSLAHPPNKVAADWIVKELAPQLLLVNRDIELVLAGIGTDAYDGAQINVSGLGLVADLKELYAETFATIAPMRVAAGINGKVVESLCFRVPAIVSEAVSLNLPDNLLGCCEVVRDIDEYVRTADYMFKNPEKYSKLLFDLKELNGVSNLKTLNKLLNKQSVDT